MSKHGKPKDRTSEKQGQRSSESMPPPAVQSARGGKVGPIMARMLTTLRTTMALTGKRPPSALPRVAVVAAINDDSPSDSRYTESSNATRRNQNSASGTCSSSQEFRSSKPVQSLHKPAQRHEKSDDIVRPAESMDAIEMYATRASRRRKLMQHAAVHPPLTSLSSSSSGSDQPAAPKGSQTQLRGTEPRTAADDMLLLASNPVWHYVLVQSLKEHVESKDITELDLSGSKVASVPPSLRCLRALRKLNLAATPLSLDPDNAEDYAALPRELGELRLLESLSLQCCRLRQVPPAVFLCTGLLVLNLSGNANLCDLGADISSLTRLEHLDMSRTGVADLPAEIALCESLVEIDLGDCPKLRALPDTMRTLRHLTTLRLQHTARGPTAAIFGGALDEAAVRALHAGRARSVHLPAVLLALPAIRTLNLASARLNGLPDHCSAHRLKTLDLANNFFREMPAGLRALLSLTLLDMSHNMLSQLPEDLADYVPRVCTLLLAGNAIVRLPPDVSAIAETLVELDLSGNTLRTLPAAIGELRQLHTFRLRANRLAVLPVELCSLASLETLDVAHNRLTALPERLFDLTGLRSAHTYKAMRPTGLWLHGNPITHPPQHIWMTTDISSLYTYMQQLTMRTALLTMLPTKVVVIGEPDSGKSQILAALAGFPAAPSRSTQRSLPLDIQRWRTKQLEIPICSYELSLPSCQKTSAGGGHVLLPYILDGGNALILLVYDASRNSGSTEQERQEATLCHWLDMLRMHAPGAVVKMVAVVAHAADSHEGGAQSTQAQLDSVQTIQHCSLRHAIEHEERVARAAREATMETPAWLNNGIQQPAGVLCYQQYTPGKPLQIQSKAAVVNKVSGQKIDVGELASMIETLATDASLFPHSLDHVPACWNSFAAAIKKAPGYIVSWPELHNIASENGLVETLQLLERNDSSLLLEHLHKTGQIIWHRQRMTVIHRPVALVEAMYPLLGAVVHATGSYSPSASLSQEYRVRAKDADEIVHSGNVPFHILKLLWSAWLTSGDHTEDSDDSTSANHLDEDIQRLLEAAVLLDIGVIRQDRQSKPRLIFPWCMNRVYNTDANTHNAMWPTLTQHGVTEVHVEYTFPAQSALAPDIFTRLSLRLGTGMCAADITTRLDWRDAVCIAEYGRGSDSHVHDYQLLICLQRSGEPDQWTIKASVRSPSRERVNSTLAWLHGIWTELSYYTFPGLVWAVTKTPC